MLARRIGNRVVQGVCTGLTVHAGKCFLNSDLSNARWDSLLRLIGFKHQQHDRHYFAQHRHFCVVLHVCDLLVVVVQKM